MSWEWSHGVEAYAYARERVQEQPREWLETVYAEWCAHTSRADDDGAFNQKRYDKALKKATTLPDDILADFIWERMEQHAKCENGGYEAHCCPFACGCHMVPFGPEETDDDE